MKFGLASDLHLDFGNLNPEFFDWRGDVLLLAGDLGEEDYLRKHEAEFFDKASKMADLVLYIPGNHEYYRSELDVADSHLNEFLEQWPKVRLLQNDSVNLGYVSVFGSTFWTDFGRNPMAQITAHGGMNDYRYIRMRKGGTYRKINPNDIFAANQFAYNSLLNFLEEDSNLKVIMSHHAPSLMSIAEKYKSDYLLNLAYCNSYDSLIESREDIVHWVHGHTHGYFNYEIGTTNILCNARGYVGERPAHLPPYQPATFMI